MTEQQWIKPPVEIRYAEELKALKENDTGPRPQKLAAFTKGCAHLYSGKFKGDSLFGRRVPDPEEIFWK